MAAFDGTSYAKGTRVRLADGRDGTILVVGRAGNYVVDVGDGSNPTVHHSALDPVAPVRCPDCLGAPRDYVTDAGHLVLDPDTGATVLVPHTGCPDPTCRHGDYSHDPTMGCIAGWFPGGDPCRCMLGPDWAPVPDVPAITRKGAP